jgi:hypothetical protein
MTSLLYSQVMKKKVEIFVLGFGPDCFFCALAVSFVK